MNFIKEWNRLFFIPTYSVFEILSFVILGELAAQYGWAWFLGIIPVIAISVYMNYKLKEQHDRATMVS